MVSLSPTSPFKPLQPWPSPLQSGTLLQRYKRFLADVRLDDGQTVTVHCANSGAMTGCADPGRRVWVSVAANPKRRLRFTWELIEVGHSYVGVNTALPNGVLPLLLAADAIPPLSGYTTMRREVVYGIDGGSRIDLVLGSPNQPLCYVEIKSVTLRCGDAVAFPDAITVRGQKHLRELIYCRSLGYRSVLFFYIGRDDSQCMRPADDIDPLYGKLLRQAAAAGVEILAYAVQYTPEGLVGCRAVPVDLPPMPS